MRFFFTELKKRNLLLYRMGWLHLLAAVTCFILIQFDSTLLLCIDRWIKPMKFFISVTIMTWTMGWLMYYLANSKRVVFFSWAIAITMFIENAIITAQSARDTTSHFNNSSALNIALFAAMGVVILLFTITIVFIIIEFLRQKIFTISPAYLLSIIMGLILFLIFTSEGGMMLGNGAHTVGAPDGGPGLPVTNWSMQYGDLRIAHFFGMHALQLIPLFGFYVATSKKQVWIVSGIYFILVSSLLIQAIQGYSLFHL
ncbi:MAG: hypothetical protein ABI691_20455 [Ginsengibacter sp.]